tara:strand:- start:866 stop:1066 length:201 start_codon:yes stop_codon:yes gene_type:complete
VPLPHESCQAEENAEKAEIAAGWAQLSEPPSLFVLLEKDRFDPLMKQGEQRLRDLRDLSFVCEGYL